MKLITLILYTIAGIFLYKDQKENEQADWIYVWLLYANAMIDMIFEIF